MSLTTRRKKKVCLVVYKCKVCLWIFLRHCNSRQPLMPPSRVVLLKTLICYCPHQRWYKTSAHDITESMICRKGASTNTFCECTHSAHEIKGFLNFRRRQRRVRSLRKFKQLLLSCPECFLKLFRTNSTLHTVTMSSIYSSCCNQQDLDQCDLIKQLRDQWTGGFGLRRTRVLCFIFIRI